MITRRYVVRKCKQDQEPTLAHNGTILTDHASLRLVRQYQAHGYEAERVDVTDETLPTTRFYDIP